MKVADYFSDQEKGCITEAIKNAELNTSGEIRVHIESRCKENVMDHAAWVFDMLEMHKTKERNGVLFYLAVKDRKFAIIGDAGINGKVQGDFWNDIKDAMLAHFRDGDFALGLAEGINIAGKKLSEQFPYMDDDVNELSDDISFGEG